MVTRKQVIGGSLILILICMFFLFPTNVAKSGLITFIEWAKSTGT